MAFIVAIGISLIFGTDSMVIALGARESPAPPARSSPPKLRRGVYSENAHGGGKGPPRALGSVIGFTHRRQ